jgi:hypothetical protein
MGLPNPAALQGMTPCYAFFGKAACAFL